VILETIADYADKIKDPVMLNELVRQRLGRQIHRQLSGGRCFKTVIQVDPLIEKYSGARHLL